MLPARCRRECEIERRKREKCGEDRARVLRGGIAKKSDRVVLLLRPLES